MKPEEMDKIAYDLQDAHWMGIAISLHAAYLSGRASMREEAALLIQDDLDKGFCRHDHRGAEDIRAIPIGESK